MQQQIIHYTYMSIEKQCRPKKIPEKHWKSHQTHLTLLDEAWQYLDATPAKIIK